MSREQVDRKYIKQAAVLEDAFFNIVNKGKPSQHRVLKKGKSIEDFNREHGAIWKAHVQECINAGFMKPRVKPTPPRNLAAEVDELKKAVEELKNGLRP